MIVIPEYNSTLYNLVYNIKNNKHIIFAIWLAKIPYEGTTLKLDTFNEKFGVNYSTPKDFCGKFLKQIRVNLDKYNMLSFNYSITGDKIHIKPYSTKRISDETISEETQDMVLIRQRIRYFKRRHQLSDEELESLEYHYKSIYNNRVWIEEAYKIFVADNRKQGRKSTDFISQDFLKIFQDYIILVYRKSKTGERLPNAYPKII